MPKLARLYLDTARLGLLSPSAQLAARDFARLAGEGVSTLYWQRFLREGFPALEPRLRRQLPGLAIWHGIAELKSDVRRLMHVSPKAPVHFASRTTSLVRSAIQALCARCRNVLIADTLWPPYRHILEEESLWQSSHITAVQLRDDVLHRQLAPGEVIAKLVQAYRRHGCDGVFLSSVSHDGIQLPISELLAHFRDVSKVKLAVIDGAQELAHLPMDLESAGIDIYLAGCQKWLGAHFPLGVCCLPRQMTRASLREHFGVRSWTQSADPLFALVSWLQGESSSESGSETVNTMPLICAAAALHDTLHRSTSVHDSLSGRRANMSTVVRIAYRAGWTPCIPPFHLRSGILLLQSKIRAVRHMAVRDLQARMDSIGVVLTALGRGMVRLALPDRPLSRRQQAFLEWALGAANNVPDADPDQSLPNHNVS